MTKRMKRKHGRRCTVIASLWRPDPKAEEWLLAYYDKYRKTDMPILVSVENGQYYIRDNFLQYYVSERLKKPGSKRRCRKRPVQRSIAVIKLKSTRKEMPILLY